MQKTILKDKISSRVYCYMLFLFFLVTQVTIAQTQVKGTVSDSNGLTLPGVTVLEKGTNNGAITDFDGQ